MQGVVEYGVVGGICEDKPATQMQDLKGKTESKDLRPSS